jgi:hypothetical protein
VVGGDKAAWNPGRTAHTEARINLPTVTPATSGGVMRLAAALGSVRGTSARCQTDHGHNASLRSSELADLQCTKRIRWLIVVRAPPLRLVPPTPLRCAAVHRRLRCEIRRYRPTRHIRRSVSNRCWTKVGGDVTEKADSIGDAAVMSVGVTEGRALQESVNFRCKKAVFGPKEVQIFVDLIDETGSLPS